jgi:hypothetical protein
MRRDKIEDLVAPDLTAAVRRDVIAMLEAWEHPRVDAWPDGTKIGRDARRVGYVGYQPELHWVIELPSGDVFIEYPQCDHVHDPWVLWSYEVRRDGRVEAFPRVAQTDFKPAGGDKNRNTAIAVGLQRSYLVGTLRAPTVEMLPAAIVREGVYGSGEHVSIEALYGYPEERDALRKKLCP